MGLCLKEIELALRSIRTEGLVKDINVYHFQIALIEQIYRNLSILIGSYRPLRLVSPLDLIQCPHRGDVSNFLYSAYIGVSVRRSPLKNVA